MTAKRRAPAGLGPGGRALWSGIIEEHDLDIVQVVQLTEACRMKDRLDEMDSIIHGEGVLNLLRFRLDVAGTLEDPDATVTVKFDAVLERANATANAMKQLLAAMRLPDADSGKRPQRRGGARGAQQPTIPGGKAGTVSSIERARERKSG